MHPTSDDHFKAEIVRIIIEILYTLQYDTIAEFNVDSKAEYTA